MDTTTSHGINTDCHKHFQKEPSTMETLLVSKILRIGIGFFIFMMNLTAIMILFKCKKMAFQVRIFTTQLAIADSLLGILVIVSGQRIASMSLVTRRINFHCSLALHLMTHLTITAMSCDRFVAICFPLQYRHAITARKMKYLSAFLLVVSIGLSLVLLIWMDPHESMAVEFLEIMGKDGIKLVTGVYVSVTIMNTFFYLGILWTLLH